MNGHRFAASEEDAAQAIVGLAAGATAEDVFADWLRQHVEFDPGGEDDGRAGR